MSVEKICNESNHTKVAFNQEKKIILPCCYQQYFIGSTKGWMGVIIFYGFGEMMNESDEVWRWVRRNYVMSRIIKNSFNRKKKLLLPCYYQWCPIELTKQWMGVVMFDEINERVNRGNEVWRWMQQKCVMSLFIQKLRSIEKINFCYLAVTNDSLLNQQKHEW